LAEQTCAAASCAAWLAIARETVGMSAATRTAKHAIHAVR
jgi:hypothetical protein